MRLPNEIRKTFAIDCFPDSARKYQRGYAVVAVDVIRATTMAITSVALGRRCFPVPTLAAAQAMAASLPHAVLAGEVAGDQPEGFEMTNSPAELSLRRDSSRPLVLLSTSGTKLIFLADRADAIYLACFRNYEAVARHLTGRHDRVAIVGAGSRGEFREEDQMCCAWIGQRLMEAGYAPESQEAAEVVERWRGMSPEACAGGNSAKYLARTGYLKDLDFILEHVNDLQSTYRMEGNEVMELAVEPAKEIYEACA
ncbi:MAG: 2-phosphosulfolactate phosphatase [Acidobacteriota bacterium]|nr:2-phosphosulfolactate phosphatase [Acidobacteriota bacterium]